MTPRVLLHNSCCLVGRTVVNDHPSKWKVRLGNHGLQRVPDYGLLVSRGRDEDVVHRSTLVCVVIASTHQELRCRR